MNCFDDKILVSIVIPVYNSELYIEKCINSIIAQSYANLQIIIVDDGSTDNSLEICSSFMKKDSRIEVIHMQNGGVVAARKKGLQHAKGDYIGFVDSDDYVDSEMFETLVTALEQSNADFVHSGYKEICDESTNIINDFSDCVVEFNDSEDRQNFLVNYFLNIKQGNVLSYSIWSKLFKRELIIKCFNKVSDNQVLGEDAICLCECILESRKIRLLPYAMYNYNVRDLSLSHTDQKKLLQRQIRCCAEIIDLLVMRGYDIKLQDYIYEFCKSFILPFCKEDNGGLPNIHKYYISNTTPFKGKNIIIYGMGVVGKDIYMQLSSERYINVVGIIDKNINYIKDARIDINCLGDLRNITFDLIIIAVAKREKMEEIKYELINFGIDTEKIKWANPSKYY